MKWNDLQRPWQVCFEEAWQAFLAGSLPIGAALFNPEGQLLARGRNHIYDDHALPGQLSLHQFAHAEMNTLLQIDRRSADLHSCAIYTSVEPCPLCMGAIYMSGVRTVYFGARDSYAGSTNLLGTTPYLSRKNVKIHGPASPELEILFLGMLVEAETRRVEETGWKLYDTVLDTWRQVCPKGVEFGLALHHQRRLFRREKEIREPEAVFDGLAEIISQQP